MECIDIFRKVFEYFLFYSIKMDEGIKNTKNNFQLD